MTEPTTTTVPTTTVPDPTVPTAEHPAGHDVWCRTGLIACPA